MADLPTRGRPAPTVFDPSVVAGFAVTAAAVALLFSPGPVFVEAESPAATAVAAVCAAAATLDAMDAPGGGVCAAATAAVEAATEEAVAAEAETLSIADAALAPLGG